VLQLLALVGLVLVTPGAVARQPPVVFEVRFESGKASIDARGKRLLRAVAQGINGATEVPLVLVVGSSDRSECAGGSLRLSRARARAVVAELVTLGVAQDRLRTVAVCSGQRVVTFRASPMP
jgi:outer membrane protein OmpA-like peptidoglycan-associated protein